MLQSLLIKQKWWSRLTLKKVSVVYKKMYIQLESVLCNSNQNVSRITINKVVGWLWRLEAILWRHHGGSRCTDCNPTPLFPPGKRSMAILWYSTLWTTSSFSEASCGWLSLWRVLMIAFWTTVKSAIFLLFEVACTELERGIQGVLSNSLQVEMKYSYITEMH